jgi:hypothetical protein
MLRFSETGYVGGDVEDLCELCGAPGGDIIRAQYGIIYIDETMVPANTPTGRTSAGGRSDQPAKIDEETDVPARSPQDIAGRQP